MRAGELRREGDYWKVAFDERELRVRDSKGLRYLAELLRRPGAEIPAIALADGGHAGITSAAEAAQAGLSSQAAHADALLDPQAKAQYRERLAQLREEIENADAFHDPERAARARAEHDFLTDQLASAVGLGGRDRRTGTPEERARVNVTRAIRSAVAHVAEHDQALADHLTAAVRTGRACVYLTAPGEEVEWRVNLRPASTRRFEQPVTRYAQSDGFNVAYQVLGEGPGNIVFAPGVMSHLDFQWTDPTFTRLLRRLAQFARVAVFDRRGAGLSDPVPRLQTLEERLDDITAVMEAAGFERAALIGYSEGGAMSALYAAAHPERTTALVMYESLVCALTDPERNPQAAEWAALDAQAQEGLERWGEGVSLEVLAPSLARSGLMRRAFGAFERAAMSPGLARASWDALMREDIRHVLPAIGVPVLLIHHVGSAIPVGGARYAAQVIPHARYVELEGVDHAYLTHDADRIAAEIEQFLANASTPPEVERILTTVLMLSSGRQVEPLPALLERFRGQLLDQDGGALVAAFDGPARAIRCAAAIREELRATGIDVAAGLHTGECEVDGTSIRGMAKDIAAQALAAAKPGEIVVTSIVTDLVMSSGIQFEPCGDRPLEGVPPHWTLFSVCGDARDTHVDQGFAPLAPNLNDRVSRSLARHAPGAIRAAARAMRK